MRTALAALAASAVSTALHATVNLIASRAGALPGYLMPLRRRSAPRYAAAYLLQAAALVAAYAIIGDYLPGGTPLLRGVSFGSLVVLLGACLPLAAMAFVCRETLAPRRVLEGLVGGVAVGYLVGVAFVVVWEGVAG